MDLSAISSDEQIIFEGEGEATNAVGSVGRLVNQQLSHLIHSDTSNNESDDEMERSMDLDGGIDAVRCPKPICCSSPITFNSNSMFEFSKFSDPSGFEGQGGDVSVVDPTVLQNEIAELKFQNRKLLEDITEIQHQVVVADNSNFTLLTENEEMAKQIIQLKGNSDKFKLISKELEETKQSLARHEDKNSILTKRIQRLERDNGELIQNIDDLRKDYDMLGVEAEKYRTKFKGAEQEKEMVKVLSEERITFLETNISDYAEKLKESNYIVSDLSRTIEQLRMEKHELEISFADSPSHLISLDKKLQCLNDTASTNDLVTEEDEDLISFRQSSCTPAQNSIHSEIAASLGRNDNISLPEFRHDSLIRYETSECSSPWDMASASDFTHRMRCILYEILEELHNARLEYFHNCLERGKKREDATTTTTVPVNGDGFSVKTSDASRNGPEAVPQSAVDSSAVTVSQSPENTPKDEDVVRRIHEELAEFRLQLKKSQELFHAFSSGQSFSVTKSCPLLADDSDSEANVLKPQYVTCSTQTDMPVIPPSQTTYIESSGLSTGRSETDDVEVLFGKLSLDDENMLDKLSLDDDDSYHLTINLPTVLEEESEQETETSPATHSRRMSSERRNRPTLCRMSNTTDEAIKSDDEGVKSEADLFFSARSSLRSSKIPSTFNSLERPLKVSSGSNFQSGEENPDGASVVSDDHTTFGSPLSSSSPTFLTPSQGSSSQETITNHDGDKTPVNEEDRFRYDVTNYLPVDSGSNSLRKRSSPIEKLALPIDNLSESFAKGVIHEADKPRMTKYAYDAVMRSMDKDADILRRNEWRTLKRDLDAQELLQYNKGFAQEEGGDGDMLDGGQPMLSDNMTDLDDEAEEYAFETGFPDVVENLFRSLDSLKGKKLKGADLSLSTEEFEAISTRFDKLSNVFKTDHIELPKRAKQSTREFENAQTRIQEIIASLKSSVDKIREAPNSTELHEVLRNMEHSSQELQIRSTELSKKAKRVGSLDLQTRVYKMIEVMVLYVHILQNYENPSQQPKLAKKTPLGDNNVESPITTSNGKISSNNNNNEKVSWTDGYLGEGQQMERWRWIGEGSEFIRRELSWPWNLEQTWKGVKQCFSILLMLMGLVIIFRSVFPIASADSNNCGQPINAVFSAFASQSSLVHEEAPAL